MAESYLRRDQAVEAAREAGHAAFRTRMTREGTWRFTYEPGDNPADLLARELSEWCSHGEVTWRGGAGEDEDADPQKVGVLVFTVPFERLGEVGAVRVDRSVAQVWVTPHHAAAPEYLAEPHDADRWPVFGPQVAQHRDPREVHPGEAPAGGDRVDRPRRSASSATAPIRERSTADSPTKRVWQVADEMVGASRAEVVAACVAQGVNRNTAGTQYHHWTKSGGASRPR